MAQETYIYAVTRVHSHEQGLLGRADLERLLSAKNGAECFRLLAEKGWGAPGLPAGDADALIACEREKTWAFIEELAGELEPFRVFRYGADFHNLKAAVKLVYAGQDTSDTDRYFRRHGTVPVDVILQAARTHDFSLLPAAMAEAGRAAYEQLAHTANGQACDMVIDYAALLAIDEAGKRSESALLRQYARFTVDAANIKAALRGSRMGKDRAFLERAIPPAGSLDREALILAAERGVDDVAAYLRTTDYADAADALQRSMAAFECWCDNRLMEQIRPQRYNYESIEPIAAYLLARENEIAMVRLILSVKVNQLSDDMLRERWRDMYV